MVVMQDKARARVEFGKLNFASDFDNCRFYLRRFSTTIYNALFVSGVFDLFHGVRPVLRTQFFGLAAIFLTVAGGRTRPFPFR